MKLTPFLLIPLLLFITGCTIDWNDEKDKKITELEKQIQDDTFKKNIECGKFISNIKNRIEQDKQTKLNEGDFYNETLDEIFYSKKNNSCIAITDIMAEFSGKGSHEKIIENLLTGTREVFSTKDSLFSDKLKQLKGE